jgi:hypothetical protein
MLSTATHAQRPSSVALHAEVATMTTGLLLVGLHPTLSTRSRDGRQSVGSRGEHL